MNESLGHKLTNHFQQIAVYDDHRAQAAIEALQLDVVQQEDAYYETADAALADLLTAELEDEARLVPIENVGTTSTIARIAGGDRVVQRGRAASCRRTRRAPLDVKHGRHFISAGATDLYVRTRTAARPPVSCPAYRSSSGGCPAPSLGTRVTALGSIGPRGSDSALMSPAAELESARSSRSSSM